MLVRTDNEVYRVDSVWLGPPRATFPWRARYVSHGVGLLVMIGMMFLQRRVGIGLDFADVSPMKALYWAAIANGVLAPFLLIGILIVASDRKVMRHQPSSLLSRLTVAATAVAMLAAAVGMFAS